MLDRIAEGSAIYPQELGCLPERQPLSLRWQGRGIRLWINTHSNREGIEPPCRHWRHPTQGRLSQTR